jgi:ABC-type amino acid transport substrate-binding protein
MHRRNRTGETVAIVVIVVLAGVLAGTGSGASRGSAAAAGDPATDKLAQVIARGTLILATDPAYPPFSSLVKSARRPANTKCAANQFTGNQIVGYDADVSKLVAKSLGVEPCFVAPKWVEMIGGHWGDRWDVAFASIGITRDRMSNLYYGQPYSAQAERFFVRKSSSYTKVGQLSGKRLGGCGGCAAQFYIERTLDMPGQKIAFRVDHAKFVGYDVENNGLTAVANGKLDAFLCGVAVGAKAIAAGLPLRAVGGDQYVGNLSGAVDRSSDYSQAAFAAKTNDTVRRLQADGTLRRLSLHYFHVDFATRARSFRLVGLGQKIP